MRCSSPWQSGTIAGVPLDKLYVSSNLVVGDDFFFIGRVTDGWSIIIIIILFYFFDISTMVSAIHNTNSSNNPL